MVIFGTMLPSASWYFCTDRVCEDDIEVNAEKKPSSYVFSQVSVTTRAGERWLLRETVLIVLAS